ncbi:MAG: HNH endonuclease family protein [Bacteriovoracaceae bacterium]
MQSIEGEWHDPYSRQVFTHASDLDIDHIVTLKSSYYMGAQYWTPNEREAFANDPDNLIPVWKKLNREKGAKGPDEWLPPNLEFQCEYLKKWIAIRNKYKLHQPTQRAVDTINELAQKCLK